MDKTSGMASREELEELLGLLVRGLLRDLKPGAKKRTSVELMAVSRKVLRDQGQSLPHDEAAQKLLSKLQTRYLEAVVRAFNSPEPPSAALLAEARALLSWAGVCPNLEPRGAGQAALQLLEQDLPFRVLHR